LTEYTYWQQDNNVLLYIRELQKNNLDWKNIFYQLQNEFPEYNFNSPESVRKRYREHNYQLNELSDNITLTIRKHKISYNEAYKNLCTYITKNTNIKVCSKKLPEKTKILIMSDWHIPFHNETVIKQIIAQHSDADILVIPGDFLDCYSVSRFMKKKDITLKEELSIAVAVIDWLATIFPKIIILEGNHTDRVRKYFESRITRDLMFLVEYDLLQLIVKDLPNVEIVKDHYQLPNGNGEAEIGYFKQLGKDLVVGHFERSSILPVKATQLAYQWLMSWSKIFGLKDVRLFLQGHTHRLSKYPLNDGSVVIGETGTVCAIQDYAIDSNAVYSAHLNGYWIIYQENGITNINNSNFFIV